MQSSVKQKKNKPPQNFAFEVWATEGKKTPTVPYLSKHLQQELRRPSEQPSFSMISGAMSVWHLSHILEVSKDPSRITNLC